MLVLHIISDLKCLLEKSDIVIFSSLSEYFERDPCTHTRYITYDRSFCAGSKSYNFRNTGQNIVAVLIGGSGGSGGRG